MEFFEKLFDIIMTKQIFGTAVVILVTFLVISIFYAIFTHQKIKKP